MRYEPFPWWKMCWINMNKNYLVIGCAGFTVLAVSAGAGPSRSLETGRAAGYYTHSGDGSRSAKARFERFKERHSPSGSTASVSVTGEDGKKYEVDIEDPEAKARAARKALGEKAGGQGQNLCQPGGAGCARQDFFTGSGAKGSAGSHAETETGRGS